jgi:hypothetical protein
VSSPQTCWDLDALLGGRHHDVGQAAFMMLKAAGVPTHFRRFIAPNRIEFDLAGAIPPPLLRIQRPGQR